MSDEARELVMALYAAYAQDVFNYAYHNTHSVDACEELVQAVFTGLCEKLERGETLLPTELPAGSREVLRLRIFEGFAYEEIAQAMKTTAQVVRQRYARAARQCREVWPEKIF